MRACVARSRSAVSLNCESCGQQNWKVGFGELGNLHAVLPGVTPHGERIDTETQSGGLGVCPLVCATCGYVRLYALEVLLGDDHA